MVWVLRKKVVAAAIDNQAYELEARNSLDSLKIIYQTFSFPRHVVSYRGNLPATLVARIKEMLLKMHQSEEGKKALEDFEKTTRFDELPEQTMLPFLKAGKFIDSEVGIK
jgi:phosphonate transport system substrate-binding protein